jgi:hypothetical protein
VSISPLKHLSWRIYSSQKLTQISQRNSGLDAAASNTDGFVWRDAYVSSTQLGRPTWNKISFSPPWKLWFSGNIPFKNKSVLPRKECARCCSFLHTWFSLERYRYNTLASVLIKWIVFFGEIHFSLQLCWVGLFETNHTYLHLEIPKHQEVFLSKTNSILRGKQCARCSCFYHKWFSFERFVCFFISAK